MITQTGFDSDALKVYLSIDITAAVLPQLFMCFLWDNAAC